MKKYDPDVYIQVNPDGCGIATGKMLYDDNGNEYIRIGKMSDVEQRLLMNFKNPEDTSPTGQPEQTRP